MAAMMPMAVMAVMPAPVPMMPAVMAMPMAAIMHFGYVGYHVALHRSRETLAGQRRRLRAILGRSDQQQSGDRGKTREFQQVHGMISLVGTRFVPLDAVVALF